MFALIIIMNDTNVYKAFIRYGTVLSALNILTRFFLGNR